MKLRWITWLMAALFLLTASTAQADYTNWEDSHYAFKQVKTVYMAEMDTSEVNIDSAAKERQLKEEFAKRVKTIKGVNVLTEAPRTAKALLPGAVQKASEEEETETTGVSIPQDAIDAGADIYILPRLTNYHVDSYLVPAHTEWRSRRVRETWKDKDGKWHEFYRDETYPVFIPDSYVPYAEVTVTFEWYDTKTGNLVASSEDARTRNGEDNPIGVYQRIVDRFGKNVQKIIGK